MSVQLTAINAVAPGVGEHFSASMSNGEWKAVTSLASAFGEDIPVWNGCHDPVLYAPKQLLRIAARIEQLQSTAFALRELADFGGAKLS